MTPRLVLVFTAGEGITGAITRWWTWSAAGHVAGELGQVGATIQYLDATPSRGVAQHAGIAGRIVARRTVDCEPEAEARAVAWAADQIGRPYDWRAIAGMPFRRDWRDPRAWFCSEIWAAAFEAIGLPLVHAEALDRVTPRDLLMSPRLRPVD